LEASTRFDLDNIIMNSYIKQLDNKVQMSATDMAYALTSLLESPEKVRIGNEREFIGQERANNENSNINN
jgi:hypothetical protein